MIDVIILAGNPNTGPLQKCSRAKDEALIKIGDKYMVEYVVQSISLCLNIRKVIIVGPVNELKKIYRDQAKIILTYPGEDAIASLINGIAAAGEISKRVMVVTADIPLITPEALNNFLTLANDEHIEVYYPVVPKKVINERYPNVKRTYVNLKEGIFTGGNLFLINPDIIASRVKKLQEVVKLRKSPLKLCKLIGINFVVKFLGHRLSIKEIEKIVGQIFKINGRGVICQYPEVGVDVDKPSDLQLVSQIILKTN